MLILAFSPSGSLSRNHLQYQDQRHHRRGNNQNLQRADRVRSRKRDRRTILNLQESANGLPSFLHIVLQQLVWGNGLLNPAILLLVGSYGSRLDLLSPWNFARLLSLLTIKNSHLKYMLRRRTLLIQEPAARLPFPTCQHNF
jgi:hypothetical protein